MKLDEKETTSISVVWNIEDVQSLEPKVTDEQAMEVLELALDNHDANVGINWGVLEFWISQVYKENDND
jgi:hypothetical protein|tara:strand:+ start:352 stop:558 length:207 start_codon:yes stop_codon:yes gene_type:complete